MSISKNLSCSVGDIIKTDDSIDSVVVVEVVEVIEEVEESLASSQYNNANDKLSHLEKITTPDILSLINLVDPRPREA